MATKLICVTNRQEDIDFSKRLSSKLEIDIYSVESASQLESLISQDPDSIVVLDGDDPSNFALLPVLAQHINPTQIFCFNDRKVFPTFDQQQMVIGNYCLRKYDTFSLDWLSRVSATSNSADATDMQNYLDPHIREVTLTLRNSKDKNGSIETLERILVGMKIHERCVSRILRAVDELILNALFNAPCDESGNYYRREVGRNEAFDLNSREEVTLRILLNRAVIFIAIEDRFGSIDAKKVLKLIQQDYRTEGYQVDGDTNSAGLGFHGIVGNGMGLLINVKPNELTQAVLGFPLLKDYKTMRETFYSFSFHTL